MKAPAHCCRVDNPSWLFAVGWPIRWSWMPGLIVAIGLLQTASVCTIAAAQDAAQEAAPDAAPQAAPNAAPQAAPKKIRYWTTDWSFEDVDVGKLVSALERIGLELPIETQGDVTLQFRVSVPLNALNRAEAYRFEGSLSSRRLRLDQLQLVDFSAVVRYADGVLEIPRLNTQWSDATDPREQVAPGTINGSAQLEWIPRGDLSFDVAVEALDLQPLSQLLQTLDLLPAATQFAGPVTGQVAWSAPVGESGDPTQWELTGEVTTPALQLNRLPALRIESGPVRVSDGLVSAPDIRLAFAADPTVRVTSSFEYSLIGDQRFDVELRADDLPTERVAAFVRQSSALMDTETSAPAPPQTPVVSGKLDLWLRGQGELAQPSWKLVGRVASPSLRLFGNDLGVIQHALRTNESMFEMVPDLEQSALPEALPSRIGAVRADYAISAATVRLEQLDAELLDGTVRGEATFALDEDPQSEHRFDLQWDSIRATLPLPQVIPLPQGGPLPSTITASTSGSIDWQVPANAVQQPSAHEGTIEVTVADVRLGDLPVGGAEVVVKAEEEAITASGSGRLFEGDFQFRTVSDVDAQASWNDVWEDAWRADISLRGMRLSALGPLINRDPTERLAGSLSVEFAAAHRRIAAEHAGQPFPATRSSAARSQRTRQSNPDGCMRWSADVLVENLAVQNRTIAGRLESNLRGDETRVVIDRLAGRYATGEVLASGVWTFGSGQRQLSVRASAIDLQLALLPFWSDAPQFVDGYATATGTITGRDMLSANGSIQLHDAKLLQIPIDRGHAGYTAKLSLDRSRWEAALRGVRLTTGQGRWESDLHLASAGPGRGFDMSSQWKARRVDFTNLFPDRAGPNALADTRASGDLTLGGRAIRSVADLRGRFSASLDGTSARAVPGLPKTQNFLGAVSLGSIRFEEGFMAGTIG